MKGGLASREGGGFGMRRLVEAVDSGGAAKVKKEEQDRGP